MTLRGGGGFEGLGCDANILTLTLEDDVDVWLFRVDTFQVDSTRSRTFYRRGQLLLPIFVSLEISNCLESFRLESFVLVHCCN